MAEITNQLLNKNTQFRKLSKDHRTLEAKLDKFNKIKHLTEKDEVERKRLQKLKLQTKDQMELLAASVGKRKNGAVA